MGYVEENKNIIRVRSSKNKMTVCVRVCVCGGVVLWVPRVPLQIPYQFLYMCSTLPGTHGYPECICVQSLRYYGYPGYPCIVLTNLYIYAVQCRVLMGTRYVCVCRLITTLCMCENPGCV